MSGESVPIYSLFSPTDYRYGVKELEPYLSEEAFVGYKSRVEAALATVLAKKKICSQAVAEEIINASKQVTAAEVYEEEERIKHDIRAHANMIKKRVSDEAKPYVHLTATSYDIVDTANALRYKDAIRKVVLPDMINLERTLIGLVKKYNSVVQIGRTHGQHAEPITFGFAIANYVSRWGNRILRVEDDTDKLKGKFSGAVGAYNASSLFFDYPVDFETEVLKELGLEPVEISTQIVQPEPLLDLLHSVNSSFGVLANIARDMRNLQRSEIGEVGEPVGAEQVGSSTMPQKRNPINFENVESAWKSSMPKMLTAYMDQVSEHQRDLTNSLTQRYMPELLVMFDSSVRRLNRTMRSLRVDEANMKRNLSMGSDQAIAEPLYIFLASLGHPDAHEYVRKLTNRSLLERKPLNELALADDGIKQYLPKFTKRQLEVIKDPTKYTGIATPKAEQIVNIWDVLISDLEEELK